MPSSPKAKIDKPSWGLLAFLAIVIWGAFMMALLFLIPRIEHGSEFTGQLGDSFGIINSLLSAFALAGIYLTYKSQKDGLDHAKDEGEQRTTEDRFFRMLEAHQSLVNSLVHIQLGVEYTGKIALLREYERLIAFNFLEIKNETPLEEKSGGVYSGTSTFESVAIIQVKEAYQHHYGKIEWNEQKTQLENVIPVALRMSALGQLCTEFTEQQNAFFRFFKEAKHRISHYFSSMFSMIEFISNVPQDELGRKYYFGLIGSQLSPQEQVLLFYYVRFMANDVQKEHVTKSGLLSGISKDDLIHPSHIEEYPLPNPPPQAGEGTLEVAP